MRLHKLAGAVLAIVVGISATSVSADEAEELRARARAVKSEAAQLLENGHKEEAEKLFRESKELMARAAGLSEKKDANKGNENPDVVQLKKHLQELRESREKAIASKASEQEVKELQEKISGAERKLSEITKHHRQSEIPPEHRQQAEMLEQMSRRVRHIRTAAENLKAAEMHDMAHELMNRAENMEKEMHTVKEQLSRRIHASEGARDAANGEQVHKLRSENEHLRAELNELRKAVEELRKEGQK